MDSHTRREKTNKQFIRQKQQNVYDSKGMMKVYTLVKSILVHLKQSFATKIYFQAMLSVNSDDPVVGTNVRNKAC